MLGDFSFLFLSKNPNVFNNSSISLLYLISNTLVFVSVFYFVSLFYLFLFFFVELLPYYPINYVIKISSSLLDPLYKPPSFIENGCTPYYFRFHFLVLFYFEREDLYLLFDFLLVLILFNSGLKLGVSSFLSYSNFYCFKFS